MIQNPSLVILANTLDGSTSLHVVDLDHQNSTALQKISDGEKRGHSSHEHSKDNFIQEAMEKEVSRRYFIGGALPHIME